MKNNTNTNEAYDEAIDLMATYICQPDEAFSNALTLNTARLCLADSLGCAIAALQYPACTKLLGPFVPGTIVPNGSRIPGTNYTLDPVRAAFNLGSMIRWLDFNDTWLAAEWGHPSDNIGGLLPLLDFLSLQSLSKGRNILTIKDLLIAMIKAYEIQGSIALQNSFNRLGFDHVILVKVATAGVATHLLKGTKEQVSAAISQAWIDTGPLRVYRHAPNVGSRKSWAAGDATSRGVQLAIMTLQGELGYAKALSAKRWGFYDVIFQGKPFVFERPFSTYVMDNILFKIAYPAEFHAQTAIECAIQLHSEIKDKINEIKEIKIETHEAAKRIIDKQGVLKNPADRDHCLQYMVAVALLHGKLQADHYEDQWSQDERIDSLRHLMVVHEKESYSKDYLNPDKRSIANALEITFKNGSKTKRVEVEYPLGHKRRRNEGIPLLFDKLKNNLSLHFSKDRVDEIILVCKDQEKIEKMPINNFVDLFL